MGPGTRLHFLVKATDYFRSFLDGLSRVASLVAANDLHTTATASPTDGGIVNAVYANGLIQERQICQETASEHLRGHHQETVFVHETDAFTATTDIKSPFSWGDNFILSSIATDSNLSNFRLRTKK